jgi:hypothetical protein
MNKNLKTSSNVSNGTKWLKVNVSLVVAIMIFGVIGVPFHQNTSAQSPNNTSPSSSGSTSAAEPTSVTLPLSKGFVDGKIAYFIATDASDSQIVSSVSNTTNFKINFAPVLANTSQSSRQQGYVFINGMKGEGPLGSQMSVASALPEDEGYSPLFEINYAKWNLNVTKDLRVLKSVDEIMAAEGMGELTITKSNIVINSPAITMTPP